MFRAVWLCPPLPLLLFRWTVTVAPRLPLCRVISENSAVLLRNYANKNKYYDSVPPSLNISIFHIIFLLILRSENSSLTPLCVYVCVCVCLYVCLFFCFIYFLSPKYFLKKVVLVRCWEKYRPLMNSALSRYKTAVSSRGMRDHYLASASSGLDGNPIPTVSTLARVQGCSHISQACQH